MSEFTGEGFTAKVDGDTLIIEVDLTNDAGLSKSKKSRLIASARGVAKLDDMSINLNVYRKV